MKHIFDTINSCPELKKNRFKDLAAANSVNKITYIGGVDGFECLRNKKIEMINYNYYYDLATADIVKISSKDMKNWLELENQHNPTDLLILEYVDFLNEVKKSEHLTPSLISPFLLSIEKNIEFFNQDKLGIANYYSHIFNKLTFELSNIDFNQKILSILKNNYNIIKNNIVSDQEKNSYIKRLKSIINIEDNKTEFIKYNNQSQQVYAEIVRSNVNLSSEEYQFIEKIGEIIVKIEKFSNYCNKEIIISLNKIDQLLTLQLKSILIAFDFKEMNVILSLVPFISSISTEIDKNCQKHINNLLSVQSHQTIDNLERFHYLS